MSSRVIVPWARADLVKKPELVSAFVKGGISIDYISDARDAVETLTKEEYPIIMVDMVQTSLHDIGMEEDLPRLFCGAHNESWKVGCYVLEKILSKKSKNKDSLVIVTGKHDLDSEVNLLGVRKYIEEVGAHSYYHMQEGVSGLVELVKRLV